MDLRGSVDQILKVGASEEIAEIDELAMLLVFNIDCSPAVLTSAHSLAVYVDVALTSNDCEWDDGLKILSVGSPEMHGQMI